MICFSPKHESEHIKLIAICGGQEGFKSPVPQLQISHTHCHQGLGGGGGGGGGQEGSKPLSPQLMLPPERLSASRV